jgi:hypothetical protein
MVKEVSGSAPSKTIVAMKTWRASRFAAGAGAAEARTARSANEVGTMVESIVIIGWMRSLDNLLEFLDD